MESNLTKQLDYWRGKFGDDYILRNSGMDVFYRRKKFFERIVKETNPTTILEIGCNIGGNLKIISEIDPEIQLFGIEPNKKALEIARKNSPNAKITEKSVFELSKKSKFDLVFTSGVLIHIADNDLKKALVKIYEASLKYILAIEYYALERITIPYRGLSDALFKRPYDMEYLNLFPNLGVIHQGFLTKSQGFDDCIFWLFEKK